MFLPLVTKSRLPTTLAPVVSPTSCLIDPRYSTLSDDTQSGPDLLARAAGAVTSAAARAAAIAITGRMASPTHRLTEACGPVRARLTNRRSASLAVATGRLAIRHARRELPLVLRPQHLARPQHDRPSADRSRGRARVD